MTDLHELTGSCEAAAVHLTAMLDARENADRAALNAVVMEAFKQSDVLGA